MATRVPPVGRAPAAGHRCLVYPRRAVVVVAGLPGAGKTTLLRRLRLPSGTTVVDPQAGYDRYGRPASHALGRRLLRPLIHSEQYARLLVALLGPGETLVHETTRPAVRRWIARIARLRGRSAHLLVLDVDPQTALAGQHQRGRRVTPRSMERHVDRWTGLRHLGHGLEGFASCRLLSRRAANAVDAIAFE